MRIIIITQNDPFYLVENLKYLIKSLPVHSEIVGCVVNDASPFGKKETFFQKAIKTYKIFGFNFFIYYSFKYLTNVFDKSKKVDTFLKEFHVPKIVLAKHINHKESVEIIKSYNPDLLISILGNQIFKKQIFNLAPKGCLNLHTALLPKYRGLMPTFWVLKNNEKYTGVSVFYVDNGIDSGPILVQEKVEIGDRTQEELIKYTKRIGMDCIVKAIDMIHQNNIKIIPNDASDKSYFSFPRKEDVRVFRKIGKKFF
ncbi:formyltransferase family protein [Flavobacteriaceae bacterium]|nr:formyltransferase family protein [Flavobacteriaceae bacterium]